ncbi:MAG: hypothetical protein ACRC28_04055, partial [Clostridium sp.]|uniref:hypothetical protein n=1 Tax=Clostridium sp. TaxID=1506 RepID=UPI003F2FA233
MKRKNNRITENETNIESKENIGLNKSESSKGNKPVDKNSSSEKGKPKGKVFTRNEENPNE